jgi:adenylate kinase family enzyme
MAPIFLIAGAPAVGKTTIGQALAAKFNKSLHIPVDTIREMVVSGIRLPNPDWGSDLVEQLEAARASVCAMVLRYRMAGFTVIIDDFWDPNSRLTEYQELLTASKAHRILLYPSEQTAMDRNIGRYGPSERADYLAGGIRAVFADLRTSAAILKEQGWVIVDSTEQSVEETVAEILERTGVKQL